MAQSFGRTLADTAAGGFLGSIFGDYGARRAAKRDYRYRKKWYGFLESQGLTPQEIVGASGYPSGAGEQTFGSASRSANYMAAASMEMQTDLTHKTLEKDIEVAGIQAEAQVMAAKIAAGASTHRTDTERDTAKERIQIEQAMLALNDKKTTAEVRMTKAREIAAMLKLELDRNADDRAQERHGMEMPLLEKDWIRETLIYKMGANNLLATTTNFAMEELGLDPLHIREDGGDWDALIAILAYGSFLIGGSGAAIGLATKIGPKIANAVKRAYQRAKMAPARQGRRPPRRRGKEPEQGDIFE